jgi:membrane protein
MSQQSESSIKIRKLTWPELGNLFILTFKEFFAVKGLHHGAAMAYYALFALVPLLYLAISVFGRVIGQEQMSEIVGGLLRDKVGIQDVQGILDFLNTMEVDKGNFVMELIGFLTLLVMSTAILVSMKTSINKFMGIGPQFTARKELFHGLLFRLISVALIGLFTMVIIIIYFAQSIAVSIGDKWFEGMETVHWLYQNLSSDGFSILTNFIIFTFVFRYVHDGVVRWRLAFSGAIVTAVMLYLGQLLIHYYVMNYFFAANAGIAGSLMVIMIWIYYSSQIIFFGAKFVAVYAHTVEIPIVLRHK